MKAKEIVIIMLHYLKDQMTIKSIDSVMKTFSMADYQIILVDNGSGNGSFERLQFKYHSNSSISIIETGENLGFARGNNYGYFYAKANYIWQYLIVMNNDVIIEQADFYKRLKNIDIDIYAVIGPDIYCPAKKIHQNPMRLEAYKFSELKELVYQRERWLSHYFLHYCVRQSKTWYHELKNNIIKSNNFYNSQYKRELYEEEWVNPVLHGAFFIFTSLYTEMNKDLFDSQTFLYFEEELLHDKCIDHGYMMLYNPSLKVTHLEDVSTKAAFGTGYRYNLMKDQNLIKSINILLDRHVSRQMDKRNG